MAYPVISGPSSDVATEARIFSLPAGSAFTLTPAGGAVNVQFLPGVDQMSFEKGCNDGAAFTWLTPTWGTGVSAGVTKTCARSMLLAVALDTATSYTLTAVTPPVEEYFVGESVLADVFDSDITVKGDILTTTGKGLDAATAAGFKLGKTSTDRISLWGATPGAQPAGSTDILTGLIALGARASGANPPLNIGTGAFSCGTLAATDTVTITDAKNIVLGSTTGTKIGTATTQKLGFFNATPVVQQLGTTDIKVALENLGLMASAGAATLTVAGKLQGGAGAFVANADGTVGFFGATPVAQQTYIANTTTNTTTLMNTVNGILTILKNTGIMASS